MLNKYDDEVTGNGSGHSPEQGGDGGARHVHGRVGLLARLAGGHLRHKC